jgi:hypothetical protein
MRKILRIIAIILASVVLLITVTAGAFALIYPNNFKAVLDYLFNSSETLEQKQNDDYIRDLLGNYLGERDPELVDKGYELINSGELSDDEIREFLINGKLPERYTQPAGSTGQSTGDTEPAPTPDTDNLPVITPPETKGPDDTEPPGTEQPETEPPPDPQRDITAKIAEIYVLKNKFISALDSIEADIKTEYSSLPEKEQTPNNRKRIALAQLEKISALEKECDASVEAILSEIDAIEKQTGDTRKLSESLRKAYLDEKSIKKAYYIDVFANGI